MPREYTFKEDPGPLVIGQRLYGATMAALKEAAARGQKAPLWPDDASSESMADYQARLQAQRLNEADEYMPSSIYATIPTNPQEIFSTLVQTLGTGGMASTIGAGARGLARSGTMRTFLGPESQLANESALSAAKQFEAVGVEPRKIWQQTGWGRGPDGNWINEIPDTGFRLKPEIQSYLDQLQEVADIRPSRDRFLNPQGELKAREYLDAAKDWRLTMNEVQAAPPAGFRWGMDRDVEGEALKGVVRDAFEHPTLFKAMPDLQNVNIGFGFPESTAEMLKDKATRSYGFYNMGEDKIGLLRKVLDSDQQFSYLPSAIHELQHAAQARGGRQGGANYSAMSDDMTRQQAIDKLKAAQTMGGISPLQAKEFKRRLDEPKAMWNLIHKLPYSALKAEPEAIMRALFLRPRTAYEKYRGAKGELEAFSTEQRLPMGPDARAMLPPWEMSLYKRYNTTDEYGTTPLKDIIYGTPFGDPFKGQK